MTTIRNEDNYYSCLNSTTHYIYDLESSTISPYPNRGALTCSKIQNERRAVYSSLLIINSKKLNRV